MIVFHNPGEIDIRGATVAGLSAKESNSAIGYFGTGLKYSIACILRWGGSITIYSGKKRYTFDRDSLMFRNKSFCQVTMNGESLGFTTEYGKDWKPWQVFRELYANARDEGGGVQLASSYDNFPSEGQTLIFVDLHDFVEHYHARDQIILPETKHFNQTTSTLSFSPSQSSYIYYRGVRVKDASCRWTWNFLDLGESVLTEDRTLKDMWSVQTAVRRFIEDDCDDETVIEQFCVMKIANDMIGFEAAAAAYLTPMNPVSDTFARVAARLYRREPIRFKFLRDIALAHDSSLKSACDYTMTLREQTMLQKAKELVKMFGFVNEIEVVPIRICHLGDSVLGKYEHGEIELSPTLFEQGTKQLVSTLYEECFHAKTGKSDCTYDMQSALFNIIISLNEELHGVIC
jgi:hypothetical protein